MILIAKCKNPYNSACDGRDMLKSSRAQERARAKRKGSYHAKITQEFSTTPIWLLIMSEGVGLKLKHFAT